MTSAFVEAVKLVAPVLAPAHRQVLEALLFASDHSASAGQLRTLLGLTAVVQVNSAMGHVGRKVQEVLGSHPDGLTAGEYEWWHAIATGQHEKGRGFVWQLRGEVVAGLLACGFSASGDALPNEVRESEVLFEGAVRQVTVNAYERNPVARARCIEVHGYKCVVCSFDFGSVCGASSEGFIHVHHITSHQSIGIGPSAVRSKPRRRPSPCLSELPRSHSHGKSTAFHRGGQGHAAREVTQPFVQADA